MAREAIEEIKRAEEEAKNIVADALVMSEELISEAMRAEKAADGELDILLKKEYDRAYAEAEKNADDISRQSIEAANRQTREEAAVIAGKKEDAIKKVIECVLS